jgi:uncharacterized circularly permuted ATP-grasp superfamily protein/uncharacterized alpha-E superfamily protein
METQLIPSTFSGVSLAEPGGFSESLAADSSLAPHWRELFSCLDGVGAEEIAARSENSRRIIREHGVTAGLSGEAGNIAQPWNLDILPLVIAAEEWKSLEAGLVQRARLVNRVLGDLYGSQTSLRNGWLPASAVYANPKFLRGCHGMRMPGGNSLSFYAVDLARAPDGQWWVLADRTQSPSGLGFALENRIVVSSVLPEAVEAVRPRSVGGMLPLIREALSSIAPQDKAPTIVVLTPGPHHEAYFEHTYLARMLGYPLVEGGDLTVRNQRVFLKTLEKLRGVDVILRRVTDVFCDPLEFRSDSLLGVPGLLEAVRSGNVATGNALGCGLIESPAFMAFFPNLCRQLLGEELRLPSVGTWWCGGARELKHVCDNLDSLVVRPASSLSGTGSEAEWRPAEGQRSLLEAQIRERPYDFVGQEEVSLSHAPTLTDGRLGSAPFVLRAFVVGIGDTFHVMPGGLVRLVEASKLSSVALPLGGVSKDLWILADRRPAAEPQYAIPEPSPFIERAPLDVPSRTADNLFWVGRYTERLENLLRIIRYAIGSLTTDCGASGTKRLAALAGMLNRLHLLSAIGQPENLRQATAFELLNLISEADLPSGLRALIGRIYHTTFAVRDRLSADTWRLLTRLESDLPADAHRLPLFSAVSALDTLVLDIAAFNGLAMENMTRGHGWMFLDFGRRLERSFNLVDLFDAALGAGTAADLLLEPVLDICDSTITYRRRHFAEIRLPAVLNLLLLEPHNPRSLAFQLAAMERNAADLPVEPNPEGVAAIRRRSSALCARLRSLQIEEWEPMAGKIASELTGISDLLTQVYFSHSVPMVSN